jgi:thiamine biosynthesis protein ThiS
MIGILLNGEPQEIPAGSTAVDVVALVGALLSRVAMERNGNVLPRGEWRATLAEEGDIFEIVHLVGGG